MAGDDLQRRASNRDRERARSAVNAAFGHGKVTLADRQIRMRNIDNAATVGELERITWGLASRESTAASAPQPAAGPVAGPSPVTPPPPLSAPQVSPTPTTRGSTRRRPSGIRRAILLVIVGSQLTAVVSVVVLLVLGNGSDNAREAVPDSRDAPGAAQNPEQAAPELLTRAGLRQFREAYREEFGSTRAYAVTWFGAGYAVVDAPYGDPADRRSQSWRWGPRRGFETAGNPATTDEELLDIGKVRLATLLERVKAAPGELNVEDPTSTYVSLHRDLTDGTPLLMIHVNNDFKESGFLTTTLDGTVVGSFPFDPSR